MRTIGLSLNQFPSIPPALLDENGANVASVEVLLNQLRHHYWLAKYGSDPVDGIFEYASHLTSGPDWRMKGNGIGADTESKRNISNELGKAFAQWFLTKYLGYTYFCPFEVAMRKGGYPADHTWSRRSPGDLPDYVCGSTRDDICLLEAKGRYKQMKFTNREFSVYRDQILRACLRDKNGVEIAVKGFISVACWATENDLRKSSKLLVEDPWTSGERDRELPLDVWTSMVQGHYVSIFRRLQLPRVADSLEYGLPLLRGGHGERRGLWTCRLGPLEGRTFVGGIIPDSREIVHWASKFVRFSNDPYILLPQTQFFGLEKNRFTETINSIKSRSAQRWDLEPIYVPDQLATLSFLRDGSILGPSSYFEPVGVVDVD